MERVCAWHPIHFGYELVMGSTGNKAGTTHGICLACYQIEFEKFIKVKEEMNGNSDTGDLQKMRSPLDSKADNSPAKLC